MSSDHTFGMIVAVIGTIPILLIPVGIVVLVLRHRRALVAAKQAIILELISRGEPIPTALLLDSPQKPGFGDLRRGLILCGAGIGAILFAFTLPDHEEWGLGLLPLCVGLGYLATWLFTRSGNSPGGDA